jgi:hypothetical protein
MTEDTNHAFKVKVFVSVFIYEKLQINVSISFTLRKKNDLAQRCVRGAVLMHEAQATSLETINSKPSYVGRSTLCAKRMAHE